VRLIRQARRWPGWRVEDTRNGWTIYPPDRRQPPIVVHRTESDRRAERNTIARLRRAGAPV
jgi:hypothetical protein